MGRDGARLKVFGLARFINSWNEEKHHEPRIRHINSDNVVYKSDILLGGDPLRRLLEGSRYVDNAEMLLGRASCFEDQNIFGESPSRVAIGETDTHNIDDLFLISLHLH